MTDETQKAAEAVETTDAAEQDDFPTGMLASPTRTQL